MTSFDGAENQRNRKTVSRRDFLKGSAAVGASIAGAAMLGCSSKTEASAETVSKTEAMKILYPEAEPIAPVEAPSTWDKEADVVVVGSGGGGLAAALRCAQEGASVIVIEKSSAAGGNTQASSYFVCYGGSKFHIRNNIAGGSNFNPTVVNQMVDSYWTSFIVEESMSIHLFKTILEREPEVIDWLEELGVPWALDQQFSKGNGTRLIWEGTQDKGLGGYATKLVTDFVYQKSVDAGAEYLFTTRATGLVKDGDTILGVKASVGDGKDIFVKGKQGVILTAGGFCSNMDMLERYVPTAAKHVACSMTNPNDTGECIRMGMGVGAAMIGFDAFTGNDGGPDYKLSGWHQPLYSGLSQVAGQPWLTIYQDGSRQPYFDNNNERADFANFDQMRTEMAGPGGRAYKIFDANYEQHVEGFKQWAWRIPLTKEMDLSRLPSAVDWKTGMTAAIQKGYVPKSDTIEGLAKQLGLLPDVLKKAIDDWNAVCASGQDGPMYKYKTEWLHPINTPPYYAIKVGGYMCTTGYGVRVNANMEVISEETQAPIPGLYAGFHTAGGWGHSTWGMCSLFGQNALSWWSGYQAALTVMGKNG